MNFLLENSLEILWLSLAIGFFVLTIILSRAIILATRILKKIDDLTNIFIEYIKKPLSILLKIKKSCSKISKIFKK